MSASGIHEIEIVSLLLLLFVVVFGVLARKLQVPYPMVIGGLLLSFVPGIPKISNDTFTRGLRRSWLPKCLSP